MSRAFKVGIFGHFGHFNLGDEAIIRAVLYNIRRCLPDAEILAFSDNPEDTQQRHQVPAFPIARHTYAERARRLESTSAKAASDNGGAWANLRAWLKRVPLLVPLVHAARALVSLPDIIVEELKFLRRSYRTLRGVDLLLVAGSNQFLDNFGGPWGYPYDLLKWSTLAKLAGAKLAFVSVGAGPIDHWLSRLILRPVLFLSDYTSYRDEGSRKLMEPGRETNRSLVYPDLAFSLDPKVHRHQVEGRIESAAKPLVVGINPLAMYDPRYWCFPDEMKYRRYVERMAGLCERLIREGHAVFFFTTQPIDDQVGRDIWEIVQKEIGGGMRPEFVLRQSHFVPELMDAFASADIVVVTRFHGTVLALLTERPTLAICYYRKARELMVDMGQAEYAVDLDDFEVDDLWRRFKALEQNRLAEKEKIRKKNQEYTEALNQQYDYILTKLLPKH